MAKTEAQKRASVKYNSTHTKLITVRLQTTGTDDDILSHLDTVGNKQGYIKSLIRADIARANSDRPAQNIMKEDSTMNRIDIYSAAQNPHPVTFDGGALTAPVFFNAPARNDDDPVVPTGGNPWYAVVSDPSDDWSFGSFNLEDALDKAIDAARAKILVIDTSEDHPFVTDAYARILYKGYNPHGRRVFFWLDEEGRLYETDLATGDSAAFNDEYYDADANLKPMLLNEGYRID